MTFVNVPAGANSADYKYQLVNPKTINANNTTANVQLFLIDGSVYITKLYGVVTTALGSNHTGAYFRLNDQTAQIDLTLSTGGSTLSSFVEGSVVAKTGSAALVATVKNASAGALIDSGLTGFCFIAKNGANTYIEYTYSTTNTPTSGQIDFFVEWEPLSSSGTIYAV